MGFWSNLFKKKELPKPKSKKVGDQGFVRKPMTKPLVKKKPPKEEQPKQTFQEWERPSQFVFAWWVCIYNF